MRACVVGGLPTVDILYVWVRAPGHSGPMLLEIGLAGSGMTARTVLASLQGFETSASATPPASGIAAARAQAGAIAAQEAAWAGAARAARLRTRSHSRPGRRRSSWGTALSHFGSSPDLLSEPSKEADMAPYVYICIDSTDPEALAPFWAEALGYQVREPVAGSTYVYLEPPETSSPVVYFQRVPESKVVKNRLHIDLRSTEPDVLIEHLESMGATRLGDPQSGTTCDWWRVMADPHGNEFCVCDVSSCG